MLVDADALEILSGLLVCFDSPSLWCVNPELRLLDTYVYVLRHHPVSQILVAIDFEYIFVAKST